MKSTTNKTEKIAKRNRVIGFAVLGLCFGFCVGYTFTKIAQLLMN